jgi:hypothetical protein
MPVYFKLVSEFQTIQRRPFEPDDATILNPTSASPLVEGEFLQLTTTTYKMLRGSATPATVPSFAYFAEQGRYEVQAISKGPFLYLGPYEADTMIMDSSSCAVGDALEVSTVAFGTINRRALVKYTSGFKIGYVTRLPADNRGYLRFIRL